MNTIENKKLIVTFVVFELLLYAVFLLLDVMGSFGMVSNIIKFVAIVACFAMSIAIYIGYERFLDRILLCIALAFTVAADVFLLFSENYLAGVVLFVIVQMTYLIRIAEMRTQVDRIDGRVRSGVKKQNGWKMFVIQIVLRLIISAAILGLLVVFSLPVDVLIGVVVFYFISFLCNICLTLQLRSRGHYFQGGIRLGLFAAGLILFLLCDVMVGIYNMSGYLPVQGELFQKIYLFAGVGMWLFYLPGQMLITLS